MLNNFININIIAERLFYILIYSKWISIVSRLAIWRGHFYRENVFKYPQLTYNRIVKV
jgi:hypothetical protein